MVSYPLKFIKRFAVLIPGIVIAYFSVRNVLPLLDKKLPVALAIFLTYVLVAYVFIPALIRIIRIVVPAKHLPLYCVTPDGFASDPLNIGIIGSRRQLITAMTESGWYAADRRTVRSTITQIFRILTDIDYPSAPVSNLYLFGRKQDISFEIPLGGSGNRHHVRFWATTYTDDKTLNIRSIDWHKRKEHISADDNLLWVGAASLDEGFTLIRHNIQITHMVNRNTDDERDLIVERLRKVKLVKSVHLVPLGQPYKLINRGWRAHLHTDGKMAVVKLTGLRKRSRNR
jgi:hypothetical protein